MVYTRGYNVLLLHATAPFLAMTSYEKYHEEGVSATAFLPLFVSIGDNRDPVIPFKPII